MAKEFRHQLSARTVELVDSQGERRRVEPGRSLLDLGGLQADLAELLHCEVDVVTANGLQQRLRSRVLQEAVAMSVFVRELHFF